MPNLCISYFYNCRALIVFYIAICYHADGKQLKNLANNITTRYVLSNTTKTDTSDISVSPNLVEGDNNNRTGKQMGGHHGYPPNPREIWGNFPSVNYPYAEWRPPQQRPPPQRSPPQQRPPPQRSPPPQQWNQQPWLPHHDPWNQFYPPPNHFPGHGSGGGGDRVFGGFFSKEGQFPFVVELASPNKACTGSIFNANTILTAGHCVATEHGEITKPCDLSIYAGSVEHRKGIRRYVQSIHLHPNYAPANAWGKGKFLYDIAIIKLTQPYEFSKTISPIPIQQGRTLLVNTTCIITGFGSKEGMTAEVERDMTYANMKIRPNKLCADTYGANEYHNDVTVCAGGFGTSICYGDGGGPLHCANPNGAGRVLFGIASYVQTAGGNTPCNTRNPGVFTRAPAFDEWVMNCVGGDCTGATSTAGGTGGGGMQTIN